MSEQLVALLSVDYFSFVIALATVIAGTVAVKEGVERFCRAVGIEFSWIRAKREQKECQEKIRKDLDDITKRQTELEDLRKTDIEAKEEFNKMMVESVNSIKDDIVELKKDIDVREAEKRFRKLRYDILNFANQISQAHQVSAELVDQIYEEITEYEELSERYQFKNNRVNASVNVIQAKYQELLQNGQIIGKE